MRYEALGVRPAGLTPKQSSYEAVASMFLVTTSMVS